MALITPAEPGHGVKGEYGCKNSSQLVPTCYIRLFRSSSSSHCSICKSFNTITSRCPRDRDGLPVVDGASNRICFYNCYIWHQFEDTIILDCQMDLIGTMQTTRAHLPHRHVNVVEFHRQLLVNLLKYRPPTLLHHTCIPPFPQHANLHLEHTLDRHSKDTRTHFVQYDAVIA